MKDIDYKINPHTDEIKTINTNDKGQIQSIIFQDGTILPFDDFIELFKMNLRTIVAGEIVSWEDHWRFTKQTDAKSFDMYLDNVEQEGILKGSRFSLNRQQKTGMLIWIVIIGIALLAMVFLYFLFTKGGGLKF
jgi:hypothetical protein